MLGERDEETDSSDSNVLTLHTKNMILLGGKHKSNKYRSKRKRTIKKLRYLFGDINVYNLKYNGGFVSTDLLNSICILQSAQSSGYSLPNSNKSSLSKIVVVDNSSDDDNDDFSNNLVFDLNGYHERNTTTNPDANNSIQEKSDLSNIYKEDPDKLGTLRMEDSDKNINDKYSSNGLIIDTENIKPNNNIINIDKQGYTDISKLKNHKCVQDNNNYNLLTKLGYTEPTTSSINYESDNLKYKSDLSQNEPANLDYVEISDSVSVPENKEKAVIVRDDDNSNDLVIDDDDNSNDLVIDLDHNETNATINSGSYHMKHKSDLSEDESANLDNVEISDSVSVPENKEKAVIVRDDDNSNDLVIDLDSNKMNVTINYESDHKKHKSDLSENEPAKLDYVLISDSVSVPENKEQGLIVYDDNSNDLVIDLNHNETNASITSESNDMKLQSDLSENEPTNLDNVLISFNVSVPENKIRNDLIHASDNTNDLLIHSGHNEMSFCIKSENDNIKHQSNLSKNEPINLNNAHIYDIVSVPENFIYGHHNKDENFVCNSETFVANKIKSNNLDKVYNNDLLNNNLATTKYNNKTGNKINDKASKVTKTHIYEPKILYADEQIDIPKSKVPNKYEAHLKKHLDREIDNPILYNNYISTFLDNNKDNSQNLRSIASDTTISEYEGIEIYTSKSKLSHINNEKSSKVSEILTKDSPKLSCKIIVNGDKNINNDQTGVVKRFAHEDTDYETYKPQPELSLSNKDEIIPYVSAKPESGNTETNKLKSKVAITHSDEPNNNLSATIDKTKQVCNNNILDDSDSIKDLIIDFDYDEIINSDNDTNHDVDKQLSEISHTNRDDQLNEILTIDTALPKHDNSSNEFELNHKKTCIYKDEITQLNPMTNKENVDEYEKTVVTSTSGNNKLTDIMDELNQFIETVALPDVIKDHVLQNEKNKNPNNINTNLIQDINSDKILNTNSLNEHYVSSETFIPRQNNSHSPNENGVQPTKNQINDLCLFARETDCANNLPENERKDKAKNQYPRTKITPRRQIRKFPGKMDSMSKSLTLDDNSKVMTNCNSYPQTRNEHGDIIEEPINKIQKLAENIAVILHECIIYQYKLVNAQGQSDKDIIIQKAMEQYYRVKRCCFEMSYPFVKSYMLKLGRESRFPREFLNITRCMSSALQIFTTFPDNLFFEIWNELLDSAEKWPYSPGETDISSIISSTLNFVNLTGYCSKSNIFRKDGAELTNMPLSQNVLGHQTFVAQSDTSSSTSTSNNTLKKYLESTIKNTTQLFEKPSNLAKPFLFEAGPPGKKICLKYNPPDNSQKKIKETKKRGPVKKNPDTPNQKNKKQCEAFSMPAIDLSIPDYSTAVQNSNSEYVQQTAITFNNSINYNHRSLEMPAPTAAGMATHNSFFGVGVPHVTAHSQSQSLTGVVNNYPYNLSRNVPPLNQATPTWKNSGPLQNLNNTRWSDCRDSQYLRNQTQNYQGSNMHYGATNPALVYNQVYNAGYPLNHASPMNSMPICKRCDICGRPTYMYKKFNNFALCGMECYHIFLTKSNGIST